MTASPIYGIDLPNIGGDTNNWGTVLNAALVSLEALVGGASAISNIDIDGGTIDGVTIGGANAGVGTFTDLTASGNVSLGTLDLDGGTIDAVVIGGSTPAAGSFTTVSVGSELSISLISNAMVFDLDANSSLTDPSIDFNIQGVKRADVALDGTFRTSRGIRFLDELGTTILFATDNIALSTQAISRLDVTNAGVRIGSGTRVTTISNSGTLSGNSPTSLVTEQAIKTYVDDNVSGAARTWSNPAKVAGTIYPNNTGRPLQVVVSFNTGAGEIETSTASDFSSNVTTIAEGDTTSFTKVVTFDVPNGAYYRVVNLNVLEWAELSA